MGFGVGPFLLHASMSHGGMGEVWRATLGDKGAEVAIKLLMSERLVDQRFLAAFEREVRAVSGLHHPQIVRVHDYGFVTETEAAASDDRLLAGLPWLAMEMASGGALTNYLGKLESADVRSVLLQLLDVLAHAHARDVIHRDLKPGNVLLRRSGNPAHSLVLTDFGLAHMSKRGLVEESLEGGWLGTTSYMAPEQFDLDAQRIGPWTDLYGLGCLAWALICGRTPFADLASPDQVRIAQILHEPPAFKPSMEIPAGVELWLRRLLEKAPEKRFSWAVEAREALLSVWNEEPLQQYHFLDDFPDWRTKSVGELSYELKALGGTGLGLVGIRSIPIVGREEERDFLWQALGQSLVSNSPMGIVIEGPAGCGKSRLAAWLAERADEQLGAVRLKAEYGPLPGADDGIVPSLKRHPLFDAEAYQEPQTANERYTQVVDGLAQLSVVGRPQHSPRPVVLWIDNLQWALDGMGFVDHVMSRRDELDLPLLVIMTIRRDALSREKVVRTMVHGLLKKEGCEQLSVETLPEEHRSTLIRELLGLEASLAAEVERRTGGIPHFTFQLVGDWVERGLLEPGDGGFRLKPGVRSEMPDDIYAVWMGRIQRALEDLPTADGIALEMAAMMGHRVEVEQWHAICVGASCYPSPDFLPVLQAAGLLEIHADGHYWSFANAMVAECLVRLSKEADRWSYQNRVCAQILEDQRGPEISERRGLHLLAAGEWEACLEPLLEAAITRRDCSDYHVASQLLDARDEAMDHLGLPEVERRRVHSWIDRARLARVEQKLGPAQQWAERAQATAKLAGWTGLLLRARRELAFNALTRGQFRQANEIMEELLEKAQELADLEVIAASYLGLVSLRMSKSDAKPAFEYAQKALAVFEELKDWSGQGHAYRGMGWSLLTQGQLREAREYLIIAQECYAKAGLKYGLAEVRNDLGEVYRKEGGFGVAESLYRSSISLYRSIGAAKILTPRVNLALALLGQERLDEASSLLEDCLEASRQQGRRTYEAGVHLALGLCAARQGLWDKCMAHGVWGRMLIEDLEYVSAENGSFLQTTGSLALDAGEKSVAQEFLQGARWHWERLNHSEGLSELDALMGQ